MFFLSTVSLSSALSVGNTTTSSRYERLTRLGIAGCTIVVKWISSLTDIVDNESAVCLAKEETAEVPLNMWKDGNINIGTKIATKIIPSKH